MDSGYSLADLAVLGKDNGFGLGGGGLALIILFLIIFGGGFGFGGGNNAYATQADINAAIAGQTSALNQQSILMSSQNNNYETSRQIGELQMNLMNQNNTNTINQIQAYNALTGQITNQTNVLSSKLDQLGFSLEQCCCSIKTLIKDNQIADLTRELNKATLDASNSNQSLFILGQLGKYTPSTATT